MTLLESVGALLDNRRTPYALIGASALAVHGVSRSTLDQDLLVTDPAVLDLRFWMSLTVGAIIDPRRGDSDDPLLGVVRVRAGNERDVDVVVGRHSWQNEILVRATRIATGEGLLPVARAADLILLKLYAGGSQDRWDIDQLLAIDGDGSVAHEVQDRLDVLPARSRDFWTMIRSVR